MLNGPGREGAHQQLCQLIQVAIVTALGMDEDVSTCTHTQSELAMNDPLYMYTSYSWH